MNFTCCIILYGIIFHLTTNDIKFVNMITVRKKLKKVQILFLLISQNGKNGHSLLVLQTLDIKVKNVSSCTIL